MLQILYIELFITDGRGLFPCDFRPSGVWGGPNIHLFWLLATPTVESSSFHVGRSAGRRGDFRIQCHSGPPPACVFPQQTACRVHTHLSPPPVGHTYPWYPSPNYLSIDPNETSRPALRPHSDTSPSHLKVLYIHRVPSNGKMTCYRHHFEMAEHRHINQDTLMVECSRSRRSGGVLSLVRRISQFDPTPCYRRECKALEENDRGIHDARGILTRGFLHKETREAL